MGLTAAGLSKRYGRVTALEGVALSLRDGEILGLIGPNGAGKTTLFECLAGVLPLDAGTVCVDGSRARRRPAAPPRSSTSPTPSRPWPSQTVGWALDFALGFFGGVTATPGRGRRAAGSGAAPRRADRHALEGPAQARAAGGRPADAAAAAARRRTVRRPRSASRAATWRQRCARMRRAGARCSSRSTRSATPPASAIGSCC